MIPGVQVEELADETPEERATKPKQKASPSTQASEEDPPRLPSISDDEWAVFQKVQKSVK